MPEDRTPPFAETYELAPVLIENFSELEKLPIFWGPGQMTFGYPNYNSPSTEKWRKLEHLNIPKVTRFIHASQDTYDSEAYPTSPPTPDDPYYEVIEILDHVEPFPSDFVIKVRHFPSMSVITYSTAQFRLDFSTMPPTAVNVGLNFVVGMKYVVVFPSPAALDYELTAHSGEGFYSRTTGFFVVPF